MLSIEILGVGRMGAGIAYSLMLLGHGLEVRLYEPYEPNVERARAEYYDLLPVAHATHSELWLLDRPTSNADVYVLCAGKARENISISKDSLLQANESIAVNCLHEVPPDPPLFVVANPPKQLAERLCSLGFNAIAIRDEVDQARNWVGDGKSINEFVLTTKGHTLYTPSFVCARKILSHVGADWRPFLLTPL